MKSLPGLVIAQAAFWGSELIPLWLDAPLWVPLLLLPFWIAAFVALAFSDSHTVRRPPEAG